MIQRSALFVIFTFLYITSGTAQEPPTREAFDSFVRVEGTRFSGNFRFIGANLDPWRIMPSLGESYSREEMRGWVEHAVSHTGTRVIRFHINGGAFEPRPGEYSEQAFLQLDRLVSACNEARVYLLIALRDYIWSPWPPEAYDPYWYLENGTGTVPQKDAILYNARARFFSTVLLPVVSTAPIR